MSRARPEIATYKRTDDKSSSGFSNSSKSPYSTSSISALKSNVLPSIPISSTIRIVPKSQVGSLSNGLSDLTLTKHNKSKSTESSSSSSNEESHVTALTNSASSYELNDSSQSKQLGSYSGSLSQLSLRGLVGLKNLGNTCFMNSILQCLSNTTELLTFCLHDKYHLEINKNSPMKGALLLSYCELINQLWSHKSQFAEPVSPYTFKNQIQKFAPRFMGYSQQDAQEFLRYVLEGLHEDLNRVKTRPLAEIPNYELEDKMKDSAKADLYWNRYMKRDNSMIVDLFAGQLMSTLECVECGFKSTTFDPFYDLSLPIVKKITSVDIIECLRLFVSKEELNGNEKPMCGRCKQLRKCHKWFRIHRFPKILVLHLKRFSGDKYRSKMSGLVSYPIDRLDLSEFASDTSCNAKEGVYRLYGVSNHSGSCYGGHYTAYCRHPYSNDWYEFNDSRVRSIRDSTVVSSEGYVLFYSMVT